MAVTLCRTSPSLMLRSRSWSAALAAAILLTACSRPPLPRPDPAFAPYITAFTAGPVSAASPVLVRLAEGLTLTDTSAGTIASLFDLDPEVEGSVRWHDARTLAFVPDNALRPGTDHAVTFRLGAIVKVPEHLSSFRFGFHTLEQHLAVDLADVAPLDGEGGGLQSITWLVTTADQARADQLAACFRVRQDGRDVPVRVSSGPDGRRHDLVADSVRQGTSATTVELIWDGAAIGSGDEGRTSLDLPEAGRFTLLSARALLDGEQQVRLLFSEPPDAAQDLTGLAGITGEPPMRIAVEGNTLVLHPDGPQHGEQVVYAAAGLRTASGTALDRDVTTRVRFPEPGPAVRFTDDGVVLPTTGGRKLPFEAVNLRAVTVRVIRVHADNIPQFLQVNDLAGGDELARVGRLVAEQDVPLTSTDGSDPGQWNRYFLDLDKLVSPEPGAIHRVELGFRQDQSVFPCGTGAPPSPGTWMTGRTEQPTLDDSFFDRAGAYYYDDDPWYPDDYDHRERDNPCSSSYYGGRRKVSRNVLSSDLGLLAKRDANGRLRVVVSDLRTGSAVTGAEVDVLDLQLRTLGRLTTDGQGFADLETPAHTPFLVVARSKDQRGYLRVDDGSALDLSAFDVGGEALPQGLKGYLFGDRGVWRPGDSLHLAFILHDRDDVLPRDHPVVFELLDPNGRVVQRSVRRQAVGDQYGFPCATSPDAPTGLWLGRVTVGDATFHRSLRIETVKPNRMRIALDLGSGPLLADQLPRITRLEAAWLHGAPAVHSPVVVSVGLAPGAFGPAGLDGFVFDDLGHALNDGEVVVFEGRTDARGLALFPFDLKPSAGAPSALRLTVISRVSDPGGDASMDQQEVVLHPYRTYVGLRPPAPDGAWGAYTAGRPHRFDLVSVDGSGRPVPGPPLKVQVLKVDEERWWHGAMDGPTSGRTGEGLRLVSTHDVVTDAQGRGSVDVRMEATASGRYLVRAEDPASGHVAVVSLHVSAEGTAVPAGRGKDPAATRLAISTTRDRYAPGDEVELTIPSTRNGTAIVSLENGHRVVEITRIALTEGGTTHRFKATAAMMPNIHAHVTLLQPHAEVDNDLPIRLYGVIPILVEDPSTRLEPLIEAPAEIKPGREFTISVVEKSGRAMHYMLYAVDEGLLDLTRFRTPDPWASLYAREALGVHSFDLYDQVIGAFGVEAGRVLAVGGSDGGGPVDPSRIGRFKHVVLHAGPLSLAPGQRGTHRFTVDNYVGSLRVMVVASHPDGAYGNAERTVPVRQPLMVLATLPRVLGPDESVDLPVTVFAMDKAMREVSVKVDLSGAVTGEGALERVVRFERTGEQVIRFRLRAQERTGAAQVNVTARAGTERASTRIDIGVRSPMLPITRSEDGVVSPGGQLDLSVDPIGTAGTNTAVVEVTSMPPLGLERRLRELLGYPHGCLEQTVSKAFPQLYLDGLIDLSPALKEQVDADVGAAIRKLASFQRGDGRFSYWPGGTHTDDWSSIYAGHFLLEAARTGHAVPAAMRTAWIGAQRNAARSWSPAVDGRSAFVQAYRLFALALAGAAEPAAMNRLRSLPALEPMARWTLAAAYAELGRTDAASALTTGASVGIADYAELSGTYGSAVRDEALIAMSLLRSARLPEAGPVIMRIAERLGSEEWLSTQSTAFALMAVSRYTAAHGRNTGLDLVVTIDRKPTAVRSDRSAWRMTLEAPDRPHSVQVVNKGTGMVFTRITRLGTPAQGVEHASSNGLAIRTTFTGSDGGTLDPAQLTQGTDVLLKVEVTHVGTEPVYSNLALTQIFPSGWEVRNARMEGLERIHTDSPYTHQDVRDDRVMTYFDLARGQKAVFHLRATAAYAGRYHFPGAQVEAMYDARIHARTQGGPVQVIVPWAEPQAGR